MTKSKIILASLGVVAGLGTAALPLASYATITPQSVSGNVDLFVEVQPAIAMTISGNNDSHTHYDGDHTEGALDVFSPANADYPTTKYTVDGHQENHVGDATENATLASRTFSSSYASLLPQSVLLGDRSAATPENNFGSTVTVYTNNATGYNLTLEDGDDDTYLNKIGGVAGTDRIAAGTTLTAGTSNWAYKVTASAATSPDAAGTADKTTWTAIAVNGGDAGDATGEEAIAAAKAASIKIAHEDNKTNNGTEYIVDYAVSTSADLATGVYTDTIVYTATTK